MSAGDGAAAGAAGGAGGARHRVVLDTDLSLGEPGSEVDDGFALALALADPGIDLAAVTTVYGNTDLSSVTTLTLDLLHRLGAAGVPVHAGADRPLLRPGPPPGRVPAGTPVRAPASTRAAAVLVDLVRSAPGAVTVVAIGPLTNVALAARLDPGFAADVGRLVVMGGTYLSPAPRAGMPGEFNVWNDPEALRIVLDAGLVPDLVGLDVTLRVRLTRERAREMAADGRPFPAFAGEHALAWIDRLERDGEERAGSCALHDPLAVAVVTRPDLVVWRDAHVVVSTDDALRGAVLADLAPAPDGGDGPRRNARVAVDVDPAAFTEHFTACLARG